MYQRPENCAKSCLLHRYDTLLDKVFWQRYLEEANSAVISIDYSQNIKLTEKNQVKSGHFSGKKQTLHDSLIQNKGHHHYVYHLSNDTNHDSVMTKAILNDLIVNYPEIIESGTLILRSDNCTTQYKSRFVFKALMELAKKYNIQIIFFYAEACHGTGLIDTMAWFGCKGPLRKEIVTNNAWFSNADGMHSFLSKNFELDPSKKYFLISEHNTADERKEGQEEQKIKGSSKAHVISFNPDGKTFQKWETVKEFLDKKELELEEDEPDVNEMEGDQFEEQEAEDQTWLESIEVNDIYNMIERGSFVAITAEPNSHEMFHVMMVQEKHC